MMTHGERSISQVGVREMEGPGHNHQVTEERSGITCALERQLCIQVEMEAGADRSS